MMISSLFYVSNLSKIMSLLIVSIGLIIAKFSWNYLQGDTHKTKFYVNLLLLQSSVLLLIHADHFVLFSFFWLISNALLVRMMYHNSSWQAAYYSACIAAKSLFAGWLLLVCGFLGLYSKTNMTSIHNLGNEFFLYDWLAYLSLGFILIAVMIQSAVMPAHRWLLNSLNAPTPVSACMHAGLINAGIFLLVQLAPLYLQSSVLLYLIFGIGVITATLGVAYKLIQPNVKRMLACSTIAQMGFVFVQCGLGFFTAAIAHVFWHGLFKAYLFLTSPAIEEQRDDDVVQLRHFSVLIGLLSGLLSSMSFVYVQGLSNIFSTTTLGLLMVAFVAGMQLAITIMQSAVFADIFIVFFASMSLGFIYGIVDMMIHYPLGSLHGMQAQPLTIWYVVGLFILFVPWVCILMYSYMKSLSWFQRLYAYGYVYCLRQTQADSKASTLHRNQYQYK